MFDSIFGEAFINEDYRLLGRKLKPFCLYYQFWLENVQSPLLQGGPVENDDIILFWRICQLKFGENPRIRKTDFLRTIWCDKAKAHRIIVAYLTDYFSPPQLWQKSMPVGIETHRGPMPQTLQLLSRCMMLGFSHEEAWMLPLGLAHWYSAAHIENTHSGLSFQTEHQRKMMEEMKKRQEAKEKEEANG